jgi:hypothetical protein
VKKGNKIKRRRETLSLRKITTEIWRGTVKKMGRQKRKA